jgi:hypothetical protein
MAGAGKDGVASLAIDCTGVGFVRLTLQHLKASATGTVSGEIRQWRVSVFLTLAFKKLRLKAKNAFSPLSKKQTKGRSAKRHVWN